jgi:hypothetical protein
MSARFVQSLVPHFENAGQPSSSKEFVVQGDVGDKQVFYSWSSVACSAELLQFELESEPEGR